MSVFSFVRADYCNRNNYKICYIQFNTLNMIISKLLSLNITHNYYKKLLCYEA